MDVGHPGNEGFGTLIRPTTLAGVHLGKEFIPLTEELKGEIEFATLDQAFVIYTSIAIVRIRGTPAFFLGHEGRPASSTFGSEGQIYATQQVCDNLNTHAPGVFYEMFSPEQARNLLNRLGIHHTPKHGS